MPRSIGSPEGLPDLGALFEQAPMATVYVDAELRFIQVNDEFCRFVRLPREAIIGRRVIEVPAAGFDMIMIDRILTGQVLAGVPLVNWALEQEIDGVRRVYAWSAFRVADHGRVLGALGWLTDVTARERAAAALDQARARLDLLARASSDIGTTLDIRQTCAELADLAVPELADRISIELLDQVLRGEDTGRDQPGTTGFVRLRRVIMRDVRPGAVLAYREGDEIVAPLAQGRVAVIFRGEPVLATRLADAASEVTYTPGHAHVLLGRGVHTLMVVPLIARGTTLGVASFGRAEQRNPYDDADLRLVSDLASRAALHIDNARLYAREHDTAVTLQRSLLPQAIPEVEGLQIAYGYQPANRSAEAGGDWFDVLPLQDGQVALVIGDVTGHSIRAAAIMGQLRTATVTLTRLDRPPEEIMRQLSRLLADDDVEVGATCLYARHDPRTRRCCFTSAGHPPPVVRHPDGRTEFVDVPQGMILGVQHDRYPTTEVRLAPGSVLALYTDGLVEQPGQDIDVGMSRLARTLATSQARSLDDLRDALLASAGPAGDDIALLLARTADATGHDTGPG
ncbi:MAG TPA: SpoIIE family protein phosphatase [Trebonia sp.]|jgi:PAS domain S-box-containing protein|nr:SpoIIE family protein phosphatase [Trebonia sp.]